MVKEIYGFKASIKYMDFSTDNYYLQIEDNIGDVTLYEIETDRAIQADNMDFEHEWLGQGLRQYSKLKGVRHQYNPNNKIMAIKKVLGKPIVVIGDEIGTIRVYNYPNVTGEPYYQCYSEHLYMPADFLFSPDRQFFVSTCELDKCIFKWRIHYNDDKINQLIDKDRNAF